MNERILENCDQEEGKCAESHSQRTLLLSHAFFTYFTTIVISIPSVDQCQNYETFAGNVHESMTQSDQQLLHKSRLESVMDTQERSLLVSLGCIDCLLSMPPCLGQRILCSSIFLRESLFFSRQENNSPAVSSVALLQSISSVVLRGLSCAFWFCIRSSSDSSLKMGKTRGSKMITFLCLSTFLSLRGNCLLQSIENNIISSNNKEVKLKEAFSRLNNESHILRPGDRLSLKCVATGTPLPTITWTLDSLSIPETHRIQYGDYVR